MVKRPRTRYDVAENLRNPEVMETYPALWSISRPGSCTAKLHAVSGTAEPLRVKF